MDARVHRYQANCSWSGTTSVGYDRYDRDHAASSPPAATELALSGDAAFGGDAQRLNPESLLVSAAASCQLLSLLAVAARARVDVIDYRDEAVGSMDMDEPPARIGHIQLSPHITVRAPATVARVEHLCEVAHRECFIANSLRTTITVTPTVTVV